jgi:molybdopterin molybdotransferase
VISAHEALSVILKQSRTLGREEGALPFLLHRFLAKPLAAPIDLPPFTNSAMDGFAVRSGDTRAASEASPISLGVIGTVAAGDRPRKIRAGQTVRIMTGAPISVGADAVVPFEATSFNDNRCFLTRPVSQGANIRRAGEDIRKGVRVLEAGERVNPRTIALLAALGIDRVSVFRRPRVRIVSTGS